MKDTILKLVVKNTVTLNVDTAYAKLKDLFTLKLENFVISCIPGVTAINLRTVNQDRDHYIISDFTLSMSNDAINEYSSGVVVQV